MRAGLEPEGWSRRRSLSEMDGWDTVDCTQRLTFSPCRPTQDPAIDTLRLEYLIAPCAVLALIFNYRLCVPSLPASTQQLTSPQLTHGAPLGVLHLPRGGRRSEEHTSELQSQ